MAVVESVAVAVLVVAMVSPAVSKSVASGMLLIRKPHLINSFSNIKRLSWLEHHFTHIFVIPGPAGSDPLPVG